VPESNKSSKGQRVDSGRDISSFSTTEVQNLLILSQYPSTLDALVSFSENIVNVSRGILSWLLRASKLRLIFPLEISWLIPSSPRIITHGDMNFATLAGKTALITGASRGIGFGITQSLARNGVSCILVGRNTDTLNARIAELPSDGHKCVAGDVAAEETWTKFEAENVIQ